MVYKSNEEKILEWVKSGKPFAEDIQHYVEYKYYGIDKTTSFESIFDEYLNIYVRKLRHMNHSSYETFNEKERLEAFASFISFSGYNYILSKMNNKAKKIIREEIEECTLENKIKNLIIAENDKKTMYQKSALYSVLLKSEKIKKPFSEDLIKLVTHEYELSFELIYEEYFNMYLTKLNYFKYSRGYFNEQERLEAFADFIKYSGDEYLMDEIHKTAEIIIENKNESLNILTADIDVKIKKCNKKKVKKVKKVKNEKSDIAVKNEDEKSEEHNESDEDDEMLPKLSQFKLSRKQINEDENEKENKNEDVKENVEKIENLAVNKVKRVRRVKRVKLFIDKPRERKAIEKREKKINVSNLNHRIKRIKINKVEKIKSKERKLMIRQISNRKVDLLEQNNYHKNYYGGFVH